MEFEESMNKENCDFLKVENIDAEIRHAKEKKKKKVYDGEGQLLDQSYESMGSEEKDAIHYEIESDNEPPKDEVGDVITVVKKGQVTKQILEVSSL